MAWFVFVVLMWLQQFFDPAGNSSAKTGDAVAIPTPSPPAAIEAGTIIDPDG